MNDVSADTIAKRLSEFPNDKLKVIAGQLWCNVCKCNVGSGKQSVVRHCTQTAKHTAGLAKDIKLTGNKEKIQKAIHDFKGAVAEECGEGMVINGLHRVPVATQASRAEWVEVLLGASIPLN
mmetsp:Transcript_2893/g.8571  ORF Transcript_2893/g.8571 Transcript_2893/m.8571 type:complete len:122 (-) Transcript_2893:630-995(-)